MPHTTKSRSGKRPKGHEGGRTSPYHAVINAENYHALETLLYTHTVKVDTIYIDPPYNTGDTNRRYNNRYVDGNDIYRHSKWLLFIEERLAMAQATPKGRQVLVVTIDENEEHHLGVLLEEMFPMALRQMVTIVINSSGASNADLSRVE